MLSREAFTPALGGTNFGSVAPPGKDSATDPTLIAEEVKSMATPLKPGTPAPSSGQYGLVGRGGKPTGVERTSTKGNPLPPTPTKGQSYVLVDRTKNGAGKSK